MKEFKEFLFSVKDLNWPPFKKWLNWKFYSDFAVPVETPWLAFGLIFFVALIIFGIIANIIYGRKMRRKPYYKWLRGHLTNMTQWIGWIGVMLILARNQGIYLFSARLTLTILLAIFAFWLVWILVYCIFKLPRIKKEFAKQEKLNKYLPKPKRLVNK